MGEIMSSPKGVKSSVPERVSMSCPTCGTRHDLPQITGNQSYVTVSEQPIQHKCQQGLYGDHRISEKLSVVVCAMNILKLSTMRSYLHIAWIESEGDNIYKISL